MTVMPTFCKSYYSPTFDDLRIRCVDCHVTIGQVRHSPTFDDLRIRCVDCHVTIGQVRHRQVMEPFPEFEVRLVRTAHSLIDAMSHGHQHSRYSSQCSMTRSTSHVNSRD